MNLFQRNAPMETAAATAREPRREAPPLPASSETRQERLKQYTLDQFAELHRLREAFLSEKQAHERAMELRQRKLENRSQAVNDQEEELEERAMRLRNLEAELQDRERRPREQDRAAPALRSVPAPANGSVPEKDEAPATATMDLGNFCQELHQEHLQQWEQLRAEKEAGLLKLQQQHDQQRQQWEQLRADKDAALEQLQQQHDQQRQQWEQLRADKEAVIAQLQQQCEQQRQLLERLQPESEAAPPLERSPLVPEIGAAPQSIPDARDLGLDSLRTCLDEEAHTLFDFDTELEKKKELFQNELVQEQERLRERSNALAEWRLRLQREQQQWAEQHRVFRDAELRVRDAELQVRAWRAEQEHVRQRSALTQERLGIVRQREALLEGT